MFWSIWWCNVFVSFPHSTSNIIYPLKSRINNKINKFYILMYIFRSAYKGLNIMIQCISFLRCELNSTLNKVYYTQQNYLIIFFSFQPLHNRNFLILFFENRCLRNEWMNEDVLLATVFMAANLSKTHLSFLENCPRSWNSFRW